MQSTFIAVGFLAMILAPCIVAMRSGNTNEE